jgi:rare lipoprotein A
MLLFNLAGCKSSKFNCENYYDHNYNGSVKVGEPYEIKNQIYEPKIDLAYSEVGLASWYGHHFHCLKTANGETFDKNSLSGAHNTLPLPSVVRVTNLTNNRSVNVIINDRGPFVKNRIIDVSERAATEIGMKAQGVVKVRVDFLAEETNKLMEKISTKKKIFYQQKPKNTFEIIVAEYKDQKLALMAIHKLAKLGMVHLVVRKNNYHVMLVGESQKQLQALLTKVINMGYKNAKVSYY